MFCPKCGNQLEEGATSCNACGAQITNDNANLQGAGTTTNYNPAGGAAPFQNTTSSSYQYSGAGTSGIPMQANQSLSVFDLIALIGAAAMILACFLPYASVTFLDVTESVSLFDGKDGWLFTGVAVLVAVFTLLKKWGPQLAFSIIGAALMVFEIADTSDKLGDLGDLGDLVSNGFGYYLLIISAIAMLGGTIVKKVLNK